MSKQSIKKLERQVATIQQWPELETRNFLDESPSKALELVLTLKHYANPLGNYPTDKDANDALENITICLADPNQLQPGLNLTAEEKKYLIELLRVRLDTLANEIIAEKKITEEDIQEAILKKSLPAGSATTDKPVIEQQKAAAQQWWNNLDSDQQSKIIEREKNLNPTQRTHLEERARYYYQQHTSDTLLYRYEMCLIESELNYITLRTMLDLTAIITEGVIRGMGIALQSMAYSGGNYSHSSSTFNGCSCNCSGGGGGSDDCGKVILAILAITAFIALAISAAVSATYALKKTYNSLRNIFTGEKILRSLFRLAGMAGGSYLGVFGGAVLGAMLGSAILGLGNAAGAILGMVLCACIGSGLGALISKYTAKLISYLFYQDTNPDKWQLSKRQIRQLVHKGISVSAVNHEIQRIRVQKSHIGASGSFFWTEERSRKNQLNQELRNVKKGIGFTSCRVAYPPRYGLFSQTQIKTVTETTKSIHMQLN